MNPCGLWSRPFEPCTIGVRPNDLVVGSEGGLDVTVEFVEELGSEAFLYCRTEGGDLEVLDDERAGLAILVSEYEHDRIDVEVPGQVGLDDPGMQ